MHCSSPDVLWVRLCTLQWCYCVDAVYLFPESWLGSQSRGMLTSEFLSTSSLSLQQLQMVMGGVCNTKASREVCNLSALPTLLRSVGTCALSGPDCRVCHTGIAPVISNLGPLQDMYKICNTCTDALHLLLSVYRVCGQPSSGHSFWIWGGDFEIANARGRNN